MIKKELKVMTHIDSSHSSTFRFLSQVYTRGNEDEDGEWCKLVSIAPLAGIKSCLITLDALGLKISTRLNQYK